MSLVVTQRPSISYSGETSKWNSVFNPIVYKMTRKDFVFDQINNNGGFVQVQINGVNVTSSFANGDSLYVASDNGIYDDFGLQTAEAFSGGNTLITTDIPYVSAGPGGYVNNDTLKPSYRVEIEVYNGSNVLLADAFTYSTTSKGLLTADISTPLIQNLSPDNSMSIGSLAEYVDDDGFIKFYIKYREVWTGSAESQTNDSSNQFFAVIGARQIPSTNGGNLAEYVTFEDGTPAGMFLNKLSRPTMWRGYDFLISIIVGDDVSTFFYLQVDYYDANGAFINGNTSNTEANNSTLHIYNIVNILAIPANAQTVKLGLHVFGSDLLISEELICDIVEPCKEPVFLLGRNSLGGVMQWVFEKSQKEDTNYQDDYKRKRQLLSVAGLSKNEWDCLHDFIGLGEVYRENIVELTSSVIRSHARINQQVYVVDADGDKIGVIAMPTRNTTQTELNQHFFELEIEYPETL